MDTYTNDKWVYSIRSAWSARARSNSECDDLIKGVNLKNTVKWAREDNLDIPDPDVKMTPTLYNLDAVAYESVMLGAFSIFLGPENDACDKGTLTTEKVTFDGKYLFINANAKSFDAVDLAILKLILAGIEN